MPTYVYKCHNGHNFERILRVSEYKEPQICECGADSEQQITCPMVMVMQDVSYASPIDGKPITSRKARQEDMARSGCVEYDPSMIEYQKKRHAREDADLDRKVEEVVEKEILSMPAVKREKLVGELENGVDVGCIRK